MLKILCPIFITGFVFALISCGKKEKSPEEKFTPPVIPETEREAFLEKQEIFCEPGAFCPDYVAKIVVFDKGSPRYCTGTLVSKNRLLTSASCLPTYMRTTDTDCSQDIHFFFNRGNRPALRVSCKAILQSSNPDGVKPEYWRDDVAVFELSESLFGREFRDVSRRGLKDMDRIRFFGVEQMNDFTGVIRKEECDVVHNTYVYPLSSNESSPNVLLADCMRKRGYRGAAIMDAFPRIRAVLIDNSGLKTTLENSPLLIKPLKEFVHATNFACAPFLDNTAVLNEQECAKQLDYTPLANGRSRLLSDEERFTSVVAKLEKAADSATRYYKVVASLLQDGDRHVLSYSFACFKNVSSWLPAVRRDKDVFEYPVLPVRTLRKGIDSNGRAVTQELDEGTVTYSLEFSGKRLAQEKLSDVFLRIGDAPTSQRLESIKACP